MQKLIINPREGRAINTKKLEKNFS